MPLTCGTPVEGPASSTDMRLSASAAAAACTQAQAASSARQRQLPHGLLFVAKTKALGYLRLGSLAISLFGVPHVGLLVTAQSSKLIVA